MQDLISRQAAIDALHMHLMYRMGTDSNKKRLDDWINSLPSAQETHEERTETHACDLISRQAAIDATWFEPSYTDTLNVLTEVTDRLKALPSAQPEERRSGKGGGSMRMITKDELTALRSRYPAGTRVELLQMDDVQAPPIGTKGTVTGIDDTGSLLVDWDNGSGLNVIYGIDLVRKVVD